MKGDKKGWREASSSAVLLRLGEKGFLSVHLRVIFVDELDMQQSSKVN